MINKPAIGDLQKHIDCRYMLVSFVAKRARQLTGHDDVLNDRKAVSIAVEELEQGRLAITYPEESAK